MDLPSHFHLCLLILICIRHDSGISESDPVCRDEGYKGRAQAPLGAHFLSPLILEDLSLPQARVLFLEPRI